MRTYKIILAAFFGLVAIAALNYCVAGWYDVNLTELSRSSQRRQVFDLFWALTGMFEFAVWVVLVVNAITKPVEN